MFVRLLVTVIHLARFQNMWEHYKTYDDAALPLYIYIYIYIYIFKKKQKPVTLGLWIYFHPVMSFDYAL